MSEKHPNGLTTGQNEERKRRLEQLGNAHDQLRQRVGPSTPIRIEYVPWTGNATPPYAVKEQKGKK